MAGPSSGLEEVSVVDSSSSGDGLHVAGPSSCVGTEIQRCGMQVDFRMKHCIADKMCL